MKNKMNLRIEVAVSGLILAGLCVCAEGCGSAAGNFVIGAGAVTALGGEAPNQELEQVYYLGVFDPQEQVPEAVYRITVRGQASVYSNMRFSSGWVPAKFIDSLTTQIGSPDNPTTKPVIDKGQEGMLADLKPGRRLMMFGPEGFREAPKDQRLVIVMGASPEAFFKAIDLSLGALANSQSERISSDLADRIGKAMAAAKAHLDALGALQNGVNNYEWTEPKL